jgi:HD-GYP domain-containing protein (c-di-GMP phosphodiesterase class II)
MMSDRAYRKAMPRAQVDSVLIKGAGTQWDPQVIQAYAACKGELYNICQQGLGESVFVAVDNALGYDSTELRRRNHKGYRG